MIEYLTLLLQVGGITIGVMVLIGTVFAAIAVLNEAHEEWKAMLAVGYLVFLLVLFLTTIIYTGRRSREPNTPAEAQRAVDQLP